MLSKRMEGFTLDIYKGLSQAQAYINNYSTTNFATKDSIYVEASRLVAHPKVVARLAELREPAANSVKMLVHEREERLSELARENNVSDKGYLMRGPNISAIQELNKMEGIGQPKRVEGISNDGSAIILRIVYDDDETDLVNRPD